MTDRTAPTEPTPEMKLVPVDLSYEQTAKLAHAWGYTIEETCATYAAIIEEVAASPAAPGAEVEPVAYDTGLLGDGGGGDVSWWQDYIRAELGRAHEHYAMQFSPPTTDAIRAQARREALEEAAKVAERVGRPVGAGDGGTYIPGTSADAAKAIRRLAGKPGEAEPTEGPVVVYRPQRGSLGEAMRDRVAFYSIEAFKRHVLNEWPRCGSITVERYGGIDKRIGWDTHLVAVGGMAVGFADRPVRELAPPADGGGDAT